MADNPQGSPVTDPESRIEHTMREFELMHADFYGGPGRTGRRT